MTATDWSYQLLTGPSQWAGDIFIMFVNDNKILYTVLNTINIGIYQLLMTFNK